MSRSGCIVRWIVYLLLFCTVSFKFTDSKAADGLGTPHLSEPWQKEKFFDKERLSIINPSSPAKNLIEPQLSLSGDVREDDLRVKEKYTTYRLHGEAGGKLNIGGDIYLSAVAKIPVYTYGTSGVSSNSDGAMNRDFLKNSVRNFSWRSELGIPLGEGVLLDIFYDNSTFSRMERPGLDEREEKFGTRFIFRFK